jgi:O-antigen/teichoic acid export membrane protein
MSSSLAESADVGHCHVGESVKTPREGRVRNGKSRIQGAAGRTVRHTHFRVLSSYAFSQGVTLATSLARIPLVISAIGSNGYGVALAVTSLQPWALSVVSSVTNLTRVSVSESLGREDFTGAIQDIVKMRHRARQLMLILAAIGVVLAVSVPWSQLLHAQKVGGSLELRLAIMVNLWLMASAAPGATSLGVLHADGKVALAQIFPAIAAVLSLAATAVGWALHLGLMAFVVAPAIAACAPYWLAQFWGRRSVRAIALREISRPDVSPLADTTAVRELRPRDFVIMSGAAAPPLFSTGLDPIVLSISLGPAAVAAYGLANRLGILILAVQSALYPLYWAKFSKLRVAGDVQHIWKEYRKELVLVVAGTTVLAAIFVAAGPSVAVLLSGGKVARPMLLYWSVGVLGILAAFQTVTLPLLGGVKTATKVAILVFGLIIPNEALSYVLSRAVGPAGPILASIAAALVLLGACFYMLRRDPDCIIQPPVAAIDSEHGIE